MAYKKISHILQTYRAQIDILNVTLLWSKPLLKESTYYAKSFYCR
jgi:hypothetical protein